MSSELFKARLQKKKLETQTQNEYARKIERDHIESFKIIETDIMDFIFDKQITYLDYLQNFKPYQMRNAATLEVERLENRILLENLFNTMKVIIPFDKFLELLSLAMKENTILRLYDNIKSLEICYELKITKDLSEIHCHFTNEENFNRLHYEVSRCFETKEVNCINKDEGFHKYMVIALNVDFSLEI